MGDKAMRYLLTTNPRSGTHYLKNMLAMGMGRPPLDKRISRQKDPSYTPDLDLTVALRDFAPHQMIYDHFFYRDDAEAIDQTLFPDCKIILLDRHPLDRLISTIAYWQWHKRCPDLNTPPAILAKEFLLGRRGHQHYAEDLTVEDFPSFFIDELRNYVTLWLNTRQCHHIQFETLIRDPMETMDRAFQHFEIDVPSEKLRLILDYNRFENLSGGRKPGQVDPSSHYRSGTIGQWQGVFSVSELGELREIYGAEFAEAGYAV